MATFTTYGHTFTVPDRYTEGHALTANEAAAMNGLLAEMISHSVRAMLKDERSADGSVPADKLAEAEKHVAEKAESYEFGAARSGGGGRVVRGLVNRRQDEVGMCLEGLA